MSAFILQSLKNEKHAWLWLASIAVLTSVLRWHGFASPLHTDICVYVTIGKELLQGGQLYFTLLDNKPPGIYLIYTFAIWLAGQDPLVFHILGLLFILVSQIFIYLILRRITSQLFGLLGALVWAIASLDILTFANQPHTEVFINAFLLMAIWGVVIKLQGSHTGLWWTGLGLGFASLMKTNVLFVFIALLLFVFIFNLKTNNKMKKFWMKDLPKLIIPSIAIWCSVLIYFLSQGTLPEFVDVVFKSLSSYAGQIFINQIKFFFVWSNHPAIYKHFFLIMFVIFIGWGLRKGGQRKLTWLEGVLLAYFVGCMFMVGSLKGLYLVYFQTFLPPLTIFLVLFFHDISQHKNRIFIGAFIGLIVVLNFYGIRYLVLTPDKISTLQYSDTLIVDRKLGQYLNRITQSTDRIYQWGLNAHLYLYSQRQPPVGLIQNHLLEFSPETVQFKIRSKTFDALMKAPPELIIFTAWIGDFRSNMFYQALWPQYDYFGCYDRYLIFKRKDFTIDPKKNESAFQTITKSSVHALGTDNLILAEQSRKMYLASKLVFGEEKRQLMECDGKDKYSQLIQQGNTFAKNGQWPQAMEIWVEANHINPRQLHALANLGIYHEKVGSFYLALQHYIDAYKKLGSPWDEYYRSARMRMIQDVHELENKNANPLRIKRDLMQPFDGSTYSQLLALGNQEAGEFRWEKAKKYWEKALQLNAQRPEAHVNLAIYYEIHYRFQTALEHYQAIAGTPASPWFRYMQEVKQMLLQLPEDTTTPIQTRY